MPQASPRSRLPAAAGSHPGREREINEDRVLADPERGIFAVIDGVGGESAGEVAAQTALEVLRARLSRRTTDPGLLIREAIALANKQIFERAQADAALTGMSCVLTVAVVDGARATVGHVGDSRLYALDARGGGIRKVTRDHSPIGAREDAGELTEAEAMRHPRRNEIFRDVGSAPHEPDEPGFIDVQQVAFPPESALLLCSDGLSDLVSAREIQELVEAHAGDPGAAVDELIARANALGGKDNVSVVVVLGERFAEEVRRRRPSADRAGRIVGEETGELTRDRKAGRGAAKGAAAAPRSAAGPAARSGSAFGAGSDSGARGGAGSGGGPRSRPAPVEDRPAGRRRGRLRGWRLGGWALLALAVVVLGLLGGGAGPLQRFAGMLGWPADWSAAGETLYVGAGDGGFATIGEALDKARPGQTIEVGPGVYRERLALRDGVALVSRRPRGAVLRPPDGDAEGGSAVVTARGVRGARLAGFRVEAGPAPASTGLLLVDSAVEVEGLEVVGAAAAGIEIAGADRSTVRYSSLHDNPGAGVVVAGEAAPQLLHNLIVANGVHRGAPPAAGQPPRQPAAPPAGRPGIEVRDGARPTLIGNRLDGNGGPQVVLATPEGADEVFRWNVFGGFPRERAVGVPARPPAGAPARPPGDSPARPPGG